LGKFEEAQRGTLFLDEIGDMPIEAQTRLLRVLQEGEYTTVGGNRIIKANVRIITATHRDLRLLIRQGLFREDLYYRLNVVPLRIPALRERKEDISDLVTHFCLRAAEGGLAHKIIDKEGMLLLQEYSWPGNVRELENLIKRLSVLYAEQTITRETIAKELNSSKQELDGGQINTNESLSESIERHLSSYFAAHEDSLPTPGLYNRVLKELERPLLALTLEATQGNQLRAADLLGLNRNTLRKKLKDLEIPVVKGIK